MNKGRKRKPIKPKPPEEIIQKLAGYGATNKEIADFLEIDDSTLKRNYENFLTKGRQILKIKLREKQFQVAFKGSPALLIWLGKVYLGQSDDGFGEEREFVISKNREILK